MSHRAVLPQVWAASGGTRAPAVTINGTEGFASAFAVTELAAGSVGAAGAALAEFAGVGEVTVDRRLCCLWFGRSIHPLGWQIPPAWDAIAGDYATEDGWIRLHTNAPHHRTAALAALGLASDAAEDRASVAQAVRGWRAQALEDAVVTAGGCAASMRSPSAWAAHPQGSSVATEALIARERGTAGRREIAIDPARPLAGIRVLDLTRVLAGPVATRFLAGFGAEVLRIDPPSWNEASIEPDLTLGKRCARLDLRDATQLELLRSLLAQADVVVHGYRPGALDRLGLGEADRHRLRPGLVDVSLDAYGWTGPWAGRRGFDSLVQMSSGIAEAGMRWARAERPTPLPVQALDHATGYMMAAAAIRGLTERRRDGTGSVARVSLARTAALLTERPADGGAGLAPVSESDLAPETERTDWGPARRLRPPLTVSGIAMRWDRGASALGSATPAWQ